MKQPKDFVPMNTGQTIVAVACCLIAILYAGWALAEALWQAAEKLP